MSTWLNDLKNNLVAADGANSLPAASRSTNTNGTGVDLGAADGPCFAIVSVGAVSGGTTAPSLVVSIEESTAATGTYTAITGATTSAITDASHLVVINFKRTKRFVRAVGTIAGTSPTATYAVLIVGQKKAV